MKTISVVMPTFNEEANIEAICMAVREQLEKFPAYDYEIIFIDNDSKDSSREILRRICSENKRVKAILNAKNFGQNKSPFYGVCQAYGDAVILMAADFQDPPELIGEMVAKWEEGCKIVTLIKNKSRESWIKYLARSIYYKLLKKTTSVEMIEHFTGSGLYDKDFVDVLRGLDANEPYLRGMVSELGFKRGEVFFTQPKRKGGKSSNNFFSLFDVAMLGFTSYSKTGLRIATFIGFLTMLISFLIAGVYLVLKLMYWDWFPAGNAPLVLGVFMFSGAQMFFLGLLGEYVMAINGRVMKRPLVIEETRINFD